MALAVTSLAPASAAPRPTFLGFAHCCSQVCVPFVLVSVGGASRDLLEGEGALHLESEGHGTSASQGGGNREGKAVRFGFQRSSNHR